MRVIRVLVAGMCLLAIPSVGLKSEEAKIPVPPASGKTHYTIYLTETAVRQLDWADVGSTSIAHMTGVTRNTDGQAFFDQMATSCLYHVYVVAAAPHLQGSCSYMDREGDQAFTSFAQGKVTFLGGTGKYVGLHGEGAFTAVRFKGPGDVSARISNIEMTWSLTR